MHKSLRRPRSGRRAAAAIFSLIILVVLIGFASLTIDVGALYNTRADLQNAADAAAMAGAAAYALPVMTQIRLEKEREGSFGEVAAAGIAMAQQAGLLNRSFGASGTEIPGADVTFGWIDTTSATSPIESGRSVSEYNAVHVMTRRSAEVNGRLQFFFASIFGKKESTVTASAVAVYDDRFSALDLSTPGVLSLWPFTIHEDDYEEWLEKAEDRYWYDADTDQVSAGTDGESEVRIYPDRLAPGNYGLLNVGPNNNSTQYLQGQITHGITPDDLEEEIGSPQIEFYDENGNKQSYVLRGNPGLKASLEGAIIARAGDIVAFFVHDRVKSGGNNVQYHITGIRFARVMDALLQGGNKKRGLYMQPVMYTGPGIITSPGAPSSAIAGRIMLVR